MVPPDEMTVGKRIEFARTRAGWKTAKGFAEHIGRHPLTVRRWEQDRTEPGSEDLHAVAVATGVTADWLMTGREPPGRDPDSALEHFLRSPEGERAHQIPGAVDFLRHRVDVRGLDVDAQFYRLALIAYESGARPLEAARAADFSRRLLRDDPDSDS